MNEHEPESFYPGCRELFDRLDQTLPWKKALKVYESADKQFSDLDHEVKEGLTETWALLNKIGNTVINILEEENVIQVNNKLLMAHVINQFLPKSMIDLYEHEKSFPSHQKNLLFKNEDFSNLGKWLALENNGTEVQDIELMRKITSNFAFCVAGIDSAVDIPNRINRLIFYEPLIYLAKKEARDHLTHALQLTYFGDYLLFRKDVHKILFPDNNGESLDNIRKQWFLIGLLHDIGYATTAGAKLLEEIVKEFYDEDKWLEFSKAVKILETHGEKSSFITNKMEGESPEVIKSISTAISLHDSGKPINCLNEPLAYLLVIIDESQEWLRPIIDCQTFSMNIFRNHPEPLLNLSICDIGTTKIKFEESGDLSKLTQIIISYNQSKSIDKDIFTLIRILYSKCKNFSRLENFPEKFCPDIIVQYPQINTIFNSLKELVCQYGYNQFGKWLSGLTEDTDDINQIKIILTKKENWSPIGIGEKTFRECFELIANESSYDSEKEED